MIRLTRRQLRAMRARWQRDAETLRKVFPSVDFQWSSPEVETIRNLETAIVEIDGIIVKRGPIDDRRVREDGR